MRDALAWLAMPFVQALWRLRRGGTLGARALVLDGDGQVLLVEHTYMSGWHLPGGGVEAGESAEEAIRRELAEEAGVQALGRPRLFGLYGHFRRMPRNHVALFVVRDWERLERTPPRLEIRAARFFPRDGLPADTTPGTLRRLAEILDGAEPTDRW